MGMPVILEVTGEAGEVSEEVFKYLESVDNKFSTYKEDSEISKINKGLTKEGDYSEEMKKVLSLSEEIKHRTNGYFDIKTPKGNLDPSGLVKGWSIYQAAKILDERGIDNYYLSIGGDVEVRGKNQKGQGWSVGIQHPFEQDKIVKAIHLNKGGVATSGIYLQGSHIYNPTDGSAANDVVSLTVIGPDVYQADVYATAAFAMGKEGINFIEGLKEYEGYMIDKEGIATMTSGFERYVR